jgi:hypothetical protein
MSKFMELLIRALKNVTIRRLLFFYKFAISHNGESQVFSARSWIKQMNA